MKNSDQVSCPASTGKEKWIKLTGPVTFIQKFFFRLSQPVEYKKIVFFFLKKVDHAVGLHIPIISFKVVTDHVFALESFSYININIPRLRFSHFFY